MSSKEAGGGPDKLAVKSSNAERGKVQAIMDTLSKVCCMHSYRQPNIFLLLSAGMKLCSTNDMTLRARVNSQK